MGSFHDQSKRNTLGGKNPESKGNYHVRGFDHIAKECDKKGKKLRGIVQ